MTLAHVGGLPIEETLPTLAPLAFALAAFARARLSGICRARASPRLRVTSEAAGVRVREKE